MIVADAALSLHLANNRTANMVCATGSRQTILSKVSEKSMTAVTDTADKLQDRTHPMQGPRSPLQITTSIYL